MRPCSICEPSPLSLAVVAAWLCLPCGAATLPAQSIPAPHPETTNAPVIVITASRVENPIGEVPAAVTVIAEDTLKKPGNWNYQQALSGVAGVKLSARQENEMSTPGLQVRGLGSNPMSGGNVLILLDGIPQRRLSFGGPYVGALPGDAVTRMELVKGPGASLYGRGAMSGTLQLFTSPGTKDWEFGTWNTYEGTLDQFKTALRLSGPLNDKADSTICLSGSDSSLSGWQPRTAGHRTDEYAHALLKAGPNDTVHVMAGYVTAFQDKASPVLIDKTGHRLPGIERDDNLSVPNQNSGDITEYRAATVWEHELSDSLRSKLSLAYWNAETDWKVGRPDSAPTPGTLLNRPASNRDWTEDSWFSEYELGKDYELSRTITGKLVGGASLEHWSYNNRYQSIWSPGSDATRGILLDLSNRVEPDPRTWIYGKWGELQTDELDYGTFIRNQFTVNKRVTLEAGLRYDGYERKQDTITAKADSTMRNEAVSPSAGLSCHLFEENPDLSTAYVAWGRGFWPVYRNVGPAEIAEIPPETSTSYELGLKNSVFDQRGLLNVALFRQERNDVVGTDPVTSKPANVGDWTITGVETEARLKLVGALTLYGNHTYQVPRITSDRSAPATAGNDISMVARNLFTLGLDYRPARGWFAGIADSYVGETYADDKNTTRLNGYHLVSADTGYAWAHVTATLFARNLLDEDYYSDVFMGVSSSAFEGAPRSFGVSLSATF